MTKPYQREACIPLLHVTPESVPRVASVDHISGNDADAYPIETDENITSMAFNNSKLSIEAMMPNNVNDAKLRVTPLQ